MPDLSNYAVFIAIHDAYHGFGRAITAYSYTDRHGRNLVGDTGDLSPPLF